MLYLMAGLIGFLAGGLVAGHRPASAAVLGMFDRLQRERVREERGRWA